MENIEDKLPEYKIYVKDLIKVGQNVLEQIYIDQHLGNLKNNFILLNSNNPEEKSSAYGCLFTIFSNLGNLMLLQDFNDNFSNLAIPEFIQLAKRGEISSQNQVLRITEHLLDKNLYDIRGSILNSSKYLSTLVPKEDIHSKGSGYKVGKILEAHQKLLFGIADITIDNPLIPIYAYHCKQEMGKTLTTRGILRPTAFEEGSHRWQVKSFPIWCNKMLEAAKDYPIRGIMHGADDLGFATGFNSGNSVRNYFIQRGLIKDGE